jgi:small subunit ribosomal protein S20
MANTVSSKKRIRQTARKTFRNQMAASRFKTFIRSAREEVQSKAKTSPETVRKAISELSKAASKGIIHKKNAARRISRLQIFLNAGSSAAVAAAASAPAAETAAKTTTKKAAPKTAKPKAAKKK